MKSFVRNGIMALASALALSVAPVGAQQAGGDTVTVGLIATVPDLDPHFMASQVFSNVYPHVFESLITVG